MNSTRRQPPPLSVRRLISVLVGLLLFAGCSDLRTQAVEWWPFGDTTPPTPTISPVSMLGWTGSDLENAQLQQAILAFEQANPYTPVAGRLVPDYATVLENSLTSSSPPDIFLAHAHQLPDLVADGALLPIPTRYSVADAIAPNLATAIQVNGQNYCFPRDVAILALFYNQAVFDRAEAAYPDTSWDWTQLRAAIDTTADFNNGFYGLALDYDLSRFLPFLLQSNVDADLWQGDDALRAVEYFMDLYNDEVATIPGRLDSTWNGEAFARGRAAMTIEANWLVGYLAAAYPDVAYGIIELPQGPAGRGTTAYVSCWVVHAHAANPEGAFELAAFLTSSTQTLAWANASGNLPPSLGLATAWVAENPRFAPFVAAMSYATPWTGRAGFVSLAETVNLSMEMWYNDNMTTPELIGVLATMSENPPLPTPTPTADPTSSDD